MWLWQTAYVLSSRFRTCRSTCHHTWVWHKTGDVQAASAPSLGTKAAEHALLGTAEPRSKQPLVSRPPPRILTHCLTQPVAVCTERKFQKRRPCWGQSPPPHSLVCSCLLYGKGGIYNRVRGVRCREVRESQSEDSRHNLDVDVERTPSPPRQKAPPVPTDNRSTFPSLLFCDNAAWWDRTRNILFTESNVRKMSENNRLQRRNTEYSGSVPRLVTSGEIP